MKGRDVPIYIEEFKSGVPQKGLTKAGDPNKQTVVSERLHLVSICSLRRIKGRHFYH